MHFLFELKIKSSSIIWDHITSEMVIMKKSPKLHFYLFNKFFKKVLIKICNIMYFLNPYGTHIHTHTHTHTHTHKHTHTHIHIHTHTRRIGCGKSF